MAILVHELVALMESLAPASLAEDWDNVGLQVGASGDSVSAVLVCLNVTGEVLEEARSAGCDLILTHHPLIFQPLSTVSGDILTGRLIHQAHTGGTAIFAAHTNLDSARGGLADILAELLGLMYVKPLAGAPAKNSKLVTFVPEADLERVKAALFGAGAGVIGDYEHCSYVAGGTGTFLPTEGARPTIGKVGRDEAVAELRLEMVFPAGSEDEIIAVLKEASSYEEPAYDIYPLDSVRHDAGSGRIGELGTEHRLADFAGAAAELFGLEDVRFVGSPEQPVRRIAVVPGSGADYIGLSAARGADLLLAGDFRYHQCLQAMELGLALVDIPHEVSESAALEIWTALLEKKLAPHGVKVVLSSAPTGFWKQAPRREKQRMPDEQEKSMHHLYVDGGARGNPGPAAIGAVLQHPDGKTLETLSDYIGEATNNVAEYQALISGVEMALDRDIARLAIYSDSELIVRQLEGAYRVKNEGLRPYYQQAKSALSRLEEFELKSIPRESNEHADRLVNQALDEALK